MSSEAEKNRKKLEDVYSLLIKEIKNQLEDYEKQKQNIDNEIQKYNNLLSEINNEIKYIKNNNNNYIGGEIEGNKLLPEYSHEIEILNNKNELYKTIINKITKNIDEKKQKLNSKIEECRNKENKFNNDVEKIKKAIWNNDALELKLAEIVDLKELKKFKLENDIILKKS